MSILRTAALWVGLVVAAAAAQAQAPTLATFPVGSTTVTAASVATGLNTIWELAWGPDDFLWMTERYGRISRVNPATGQVLPLLQVPDVESYAEGGLLGLVLHPQFAANPYVYVVYNYALGPGIANYREKVVRFTYSAAAGTLGSPLVLLDNIPAALYHNGSRLIILPDLTLLMTTGDASDLGTPQSPASLAGKTLRLNLDGSIPANNPTPGSYVYSLGHRNPQGLVRLPSGRIYSCEHGPTTNDELNLIEPGRNYGWPQVEGYCDLPAEQTFCAANNVREPLLTWTPTIAPGGLAYYDHPAIPGWRGHLLMTTLNGQRLVQLALNPAGDAITGSTEFLNGTVQRLRAVCVSPQGRVYLGTSNWGGADQIIVLENRSFVSSTSRATSEADFSIWPNPARQQATLRLPAAGARITVRDLLGRPVRKTTAAAATATLDLRGLSPGTYLVEAENATGTHTRKLVVE